MKLIKTHQKVFIRLSIFLLALLVAVTSISIGYKATKAHADAAPATYTVHGLGEIAGSFSVKHILNGQQVTGTCNSTANSLATETGQADPNSTLTITAYVENNCTITYSSESSTHQLGGPGSGGPGDNTNTFTVE
jgi:hypothetical protein